MNQIPSDASPADNPSRVITAAAVRVRQIVEAATDLQPDRIAVGPALVAGHFRHRRRWNCVVRIDEVQLAAIHIVHVPVRSASERVLRRVADDVLTRAMDASKAATEDLLRPWLGVFVVIDDPFWHESTLVTGDVPATRIDRLAYFIEQVVRSQLLDVAAVVISDPGTGDQRTARPTMSIEAFDAALVGRTLSFRSLAGALR